MLVHVIGTGDAFSKTRFGSSLLVQAEGGAILIDTPPALSHALRSYHSTMGLDDITTVLITHLHSDHVGGLEQLLFHQRLVRGQKIRILGAPEVLENLWGHTLKGGMGQITSPLTGKPLAMQMDDYATLVPIKPGERFQATDNLEVQLHLTKHHIPTTAVKITETGEKTFAYSSDTAFSPEIIEWMDAYVMVHEVGAGNGWGAIEATHTSLTKLMELPASVREKMYLTHYCDAFPIEVCPIPCLRDGNCLTINLREFPAGHPSTRDT